MARRAVAALAAGAAALFAGKVDVVRNDLKRIALVAGFVLIRARLDGTVHGDEVAFVEILANKFRSLAPDHDVDKVCFALFTGTHKAAVHRDTERACRNAVRGVAQFGVRYKAAHQSYNIQHYFASVSAFAGTASSFATIMERSTPSVIL